MEEDSGHTKKHYSRSSWSGFGLAVANNNGAYEIGFVHDGTKRHTESVAELATFMDRPRSLSVDMTIRRWLGVHRNFKKTTSKDGSYLGKPPGELKDEMRVERPALSREYLG